MPDETHNLEVQDTWDWDAAEKLPGVLEPGVNVSNKLSASDFQTFAESAEREGPSVADFVRAAALDAARQRSSAP